MSPVIVPVPVLNPHSALLNPDLETFVNLGQRSEEKHYETLVTQRNKEGFNMLGFVNGIVFTDCIQIRGKGGGYIQYLTNFYIRPTMRRQGYGTYMMGALVNLLRETGSKKLVVSNETSQGGPFYLKMGFRRNNMGDYWLHVGDGRSLKEGYNFDPSDFLLCQSLSLVLVYYQSVPY